MEVNPRSRYVAKLARVKLYRALLGHTNLHRQVDLVPPRLSTFGHDNPQDVTRNLLQASRQRVELRTPWKHWGYLRVAQVNITRSLQNFPYKGNTFTTLGSDESPLSGEDGPVYGL